jgi:peroxiredoxin
MVKVGDLAPDFALKDQSGKVVKLSSFKGKKEVSSLSTRANSL